jgi:eukaryotic-like serine/threonine-protein kinase
MRKVSITGGPPIIICRVPAVARGASWAPDDTIFFGLADPRAGLLRVSAAGGEPKAVTIVDTNKGETGHHFPFVLPGGRAVLFTIVSAISAAGIGENAQVAVLDLSMGRHKTLVRGGSGAVYVDAATTRFAPGSGQASARSGGAGYLLYAGTGAALRAVRFDLGRLEVSGEPVPAVEGVMTAITGVANFSVSREGTLVYVPGGMAATPAGQPRSLVWVNRQGREEPIAAPPRPYAVARLSPDGTRIALDIRDHTQDIWIWDVGRQTLTPLNLDPAVDLNPVWTPDGKRIIWSSTRGGGNPNLYSQAADGTGAASRLTTNLGAQFATSVSADGTRVALFGATGTLDAIAQRPQLVISLLTMDGSATAETRWLIASRGAQSNAEISPDGRWIAYQSDESGEVQIYVRPFPKIDDGRWQISPTGGTRPAWARSGRELFYLDGSGLLTSVAVQVNATSFTAGTPARILNTPYHAGSSSRGYDLRAYDVSTDGQRFLMIKDVPSADPKSTAPAASMVVVVNWLEELKARLPPLR